MKRNRHERLMRLISERDIKTQQELSDILIKEGFAVTQATVSRDIKELGLIKKAAASGGYKYAIATMPDEKDSSEHLDIFKKSVIGVESALNQVIIKTFAGMAQAVCASLDRVLFGKILGSIAGDDTVLLILKTEDEALVLKSKLNKMFSRKG
ncbi:MAG: arginine repressor [Clostridia bacterium]|nr:arginine repressor [Clostridia bacterium]